MSKAINELPTLTDVQVGDDSRLRFFGRAADGQLFSATVLQEKKVFRIQKVLYKATGLEGQSITPPVIAGGSVLAVFREGAILYEATGTPDPAEYSFDTTNIHLGAATNPNERFLILYHNG
jgi:hypothetical protein